MTISVSYTAPDYLPKYDVIPFMVRFLTLMGNLCSAFTERFISGSKGIRVIKTLSNLL